MCYLNSECSPRYISTVHREIIVKSDCREGLDKIIQDCFTLKKTFVYDFKKSFYNSLSKNFYLLYILFTPELGSLYNNYSLL